MRVYIHTDIEGCAGITLRATMWDPKRYGPDILRRMNLLLTQEVNAAVEGALDAGAEDILVQDSHGSGFNIIFEELNPAADIINGCSNRYPSWMPCLEDGWDALVAVGMHAMADTNGVIPHSRIKINGVDHSECGTAMAMAGYYNIPCVFSSGDDMIAKQVLEHVPQMEIAIVKKALSPYAARSVHPIRARRMIRVGVKKGLKRIKEIPPYKIKGPSFSCSIYGSTNRDWSEEVVSDDLMKAIDGVMRTIFDYDLQELDPWPMEPHEDNKHVRAAKAKKG